MDEYRLEMDEKSGKFIGSELNESNRIKALLIEDDPAKKVSESIDISSFGGEGLETIII